MKILTAIGNPILNNELNNCTEFDVISSDLQYTEAIVEFLEKDRNVDYIIINELLPGIRKIEDIIQDINNINRKINIIIIVQNKNEKLIKLLGEKRIKNILYNNKMTLDEIMKNLKEKNLENKINNNLKNIKTNGSKKINELLNNINYKSNNKIKYIENYENNKINNTKFNNTKSNNNKSNNNKSNNNKFSNIICILGNSGSGKSIFSVNLSKILKDKKVLIIDFDILNNSIHTILGIKKYSKKIQSKKNNINKLERDYKDFIIKVNNKLDLLSGIDILFGKEEINKNELLKIINSFKNKYDYIIIDTSSECFFEYNKTLMINSKFSIFLLEGNLLEIKKANKLLEIYTEKWNIKKEKIKIVFNKYNKDSIDFNILKNIFSDYEVLGSIKMSNYFNKIINKNNKEINNKKLKNDYLKISDKIIKVNFNNSNIYKLKNTILNKLKFIKLFERIKI